jgi:peroxiredoxin Q/BCP
VFGQLAASDTEVFGISSDSVESHAAFRAREQLPFRLLSDPDDAVRESYGVPDDLFGLLPGRVTFVIDSEGVVRDLYQSQLDFDGHAELACRAVDALPEHPGEADDGARNRSPDSR